MSAAEERPRNPSSVRTWAQGTVFSARYRVVQLLGSGGMADVYEVEHVLTHKRLALKLLRPEVLSHPESAERFFREASVCAGIDSQHVVEMLDCDIDRASASPFLVMELLQGKDLARYVREMHAAKTTIPTTFSLELLRQVASALDKIHAQGIVHRDLKPANLFLTFPGDGPPRVKILDFGIARLLSDGDSAGSTRLGTPLYMAPEQLSATGRITAATDLWAFGLIAFELFVGVPYWEGNNATSLAERIPDRDAHPAPSALAARHNVSLAPGFDRWLLRLIDPDPARRPESASDAIGELFRLHDPKATRPPPRPGSLPPGAVSALEVSSPRVSLKPLGAGSPVPGPLPAPPKVPGPSPDENTTEPGNSRRDAAVERTDEDIVVDTLSMARTREIRRTPPARKVVPSGRGEGHQSPKPDASKTDGARPVASNGRPTTASGMHLTRRIRTRLRPQAPTPVVQKRPGPMFVPPARPIPVAPPSVHEVSVLARSHAPIAPRPPSASSPPLAPTASVLPPAAPRRVDSRPVVAASAPPETPEPRPDTIAIAVPKLTTEPSSSADPPRRPRSASRYEPAVQPWTLWLAAAVTLVLAAGAAREILRDSTQSRRPVVGASMPTQEAPWRQLAPHEREALTGSARRWTTRIAASQQRDGSFSGFDNLPSSGWDTGQQLSTLLAGQSAGIPVAPEAQLAALRVLDQFQLRNGWAGAVAGDRTVRANTVATAWATLAYAALADSTQADAARQRAVSAREMLLASQREDGAFGFVPPTEAGAQGPESFYATVMGLWALAEVERGGFGASARAAESRHRAMRWLRGALASERVMVPGESPPWQVAGMMEMAFWVLWRSRSITHDVDAQDLGLAARAAGGLLVRCAVPPASTAPCARGTHANMAISITSGADGETVTAVVPWLAWTSLSAITLLREPALTLDDAVRSGLSVVARRAIAVYETEREPIGRSPLAVLAVHDFAALDIMR